MYLAKMATRDSSARTKWGTRQDSQQHATAQTNKRNFESAPIREDEPAPDEALGSFICYRLDKQSWQADRY